MKTLFQIKEFIPSKFEFVDDIRDALKLEYFRKFSESSVMPRLYELRSNPIYARTFETLGIEPIAKPNLSPIFRIATIEDILQIASYRIIDDFIAEQKLFSNMDGKYTYEGQLKESFAMMSEKVIIWRNAEFLAALDIVKNLACTAYFNKKAENPYAYHDRIQWARNLLAPINCFQVAFLGKLGQPYNDPTATVDSEIVAAVQKISEIVNSDYFTMVGADNLRVSRKSTPHGTDVYVKFDFPDRKSYSCFTSTYVRKVSKGGPSKISAIELSQLQGMDSSILSVLEEASEIARNERVIEKRVQGTMYSYSGGAIMARSVAALMPNVHYCITYLPLFLAATLDMVSWDWLNIADALPTMDDSEGLEIIKAIQTFRGLALVPAINESETITLRKMTMLNANYDTSGPKATAEELAYGSLVQSFLDDVEDVLQSRLKLAEVPVIRTTLALNQDTSILNALNFPIGVKELQIGVIEYPNASVLPLVSGVIYTITNWALVTADVDPVKMMMFPRSSLWDGNGIYQDRGFLKLADVDDYDSITTKIFGHEEVTSCKLEQNVMFVPDLHLTAQVLNCLQDLSFLYSSLSSSSGRENVKWALVRGLTDLGNVILEKLGKRRCVVGTEEDCSLSNHAYAFMYSVWFMDTIFYNHKYGSTISTCRAISDVTIDDIRRNLV